MNEAVLARGIDCRIGPFHSALPGPFVLDLKLDGEVIAEARATAGYGARGIESVMRQLGWEQGIPVMDRLDPDSGIFGEWAYCLAIERAMNLEVPARAVATRVLLGELVRVSAHLSQLARVAREAGSEIVFHFMLRERELLLDLMELVTGSRHSPAFLRIGGVGADVSEGFLERLHETSQIILGRIAEYNDLLTYNEAFVRRVSGRAIISESLIREHGITGIPLRIVDDSSDLRWKGEIDGYNLVPHQPISAGSPVGIAGDLHHRFVFRLQEVIQSIQICRELCQNLPGGALRSEADLTRIPTGRHSARVEAPRGILQVTVESDGSARPKTIEFSTPSDALFSAMPKILQGAPFEDLGLWIASVDLQIGEVDR